MQRTTIALLCIATLATALSAQRGGRRSRDAQIPKLEHFEVTSGTCESASMKRGTAGYYILLPKSHGDEANKDKQYPWILWLPGFGGPNDFLERGGARSLDKLRGEDKIPELAVVIFQSSRSLYMNGEPAGKTEDLLTGDLVAHLHKAYRLSSKREQRAIMGVSAGGFGALKIALRHPEMFAAVAAHSSAILPADPEDISGMYERMVNRALRNGLADELGDPIDKDKWAAHMPLAIIAKKKPADLAGLQIYFAAGTEDHYGFYPSNEQLSDAMTAQGHTHLFHKVEKGGHAWSSPEMRDSVETSLQFVAMAMRGKDAITATREQLGTSAAKNGKKATDASDKDGGQGK